jgi:chromate reductase, NAD(P)H dehydrogenase (quinone)
MADPVKLLGFAGSLRKDSLNRALLRAAGELLPPDTTLDIYDLAGIPEYNDDVRLGTGYPETARKYREAIAAADALLIVTPEYNYSIPGILKNAIDWASRAPEPPLIGKPCALMSASPSILGGARAQYHLRQVFVFNDMFPINKPEVILAQATQKFDAAGKLTDETTRGLVTQLLANLADWTRVLKAGRAALAASKG